MKYHLSDYELNARDPDAIVYRDAYGKITRLTREDFSSDAEFQKWKKISDDDLYKIHRGNKNEADHTVSIECLSNSAGVSVPSAEDILIMEFEKIQLKQKMDQLLVLLSESLSKVQLRRARMYFVHEMTEDEIAEREGVTQQAVGKTLSQVRSILKPHKKLFL